MFPNITSSWQEFSGSSPKRRRAEDKDEGIGSPDIWEDEKAEDLRREMIELRQQLDKERSVRMMLEEQVSPPAPGRILLQHCCAELAIHGAGSPSSGDPPGTPALLRGTSCLLCPPSPPHLAMDPWLCCIRPAEEDSPRLGVREATPGASWALC